jgi:hypothetical protein
MPIRCWDCRNQLRGLLPLAVRSRTPTKDAVRFEPELVPPCTSPVRRCSCASQKIFQFLAESNFQARFSNALKPPVEVLSPRSPSFTCSAYIFELLVITKWQRSPSGVEPHSQSVSPCSRAREACFFASMSTSSLRIRRLWLTMNSFSVLQLEHLSCRPMNMFDSMRYPIEHLVGLHVNLNGRLSLRPR